MAYESLVECHFLSLCTLLLIIAHYRHYCQFHKYDPVYPTLFDTFVQFCRFLVRKRRETAENS